MSHKRSRIKLHSFNKYSPSVRATHYRNCALLRVFAFWEIQQNIEELHRYLRQSDLTINDLLKLKYPADMRCPHCTDTTKLINSWIARLKTTPYKPYAYCRAISCIHNLFNCLTTSLKPEFFNPLTLELTETGKNYRDELRKACEFTVTVPVEMCGAPEEYTGFDTFKFSSSSQLQGAVEDSISQLLIAKTARFMDELNLSLEEIFSSVQFGNKKVNGPRFFEGLGYKPLSEDAPIVKSLHDNLCNQNIIAKRYTHFILALLQQQVEELLVSDNYLDRLAGEIKYQQQMLIPNE